MASWHSCLLYCRARQSGPWPALYVTFLAQNFVVRGTAEPGGRGESWRPSLGSLICFPQCMAPIKPGDMCLCLDCEQSGPAPGLFPESTGDHSCSLIVISRRATRILLPAGFLVEFDRGHAGSASGQVSFYQSHTSFSNFTFQMHISEFI